MVDDQFQGNFSLLLDGKGRMSVPARHRERLQSISPGQLTLTKHPQGCLMVFPRPDWLLFRERLAAMPVSAHDWKRVFIGSACDVEVDSAWRVLVAPELRNFAGLTKDALLIGMGTYLELWDATRHAELEAEVLKKPMPEAVMSLIF